MAAGLPNCDDYEGDNHGRDYMNGSLPFQALEPKGASVLRTHCRPRSARLTAAALAAFVGLAALAPAHAASKSAPAKTAVSPEAAKSDTTIAQAITQAGKGGKTAGTTQVIVKYDGDLTDARRAELKALGAVIYQDLSIVHSVALRLPTANLSRLADLSFVTHLSSDGAVKKCDLFTVGSSLADVAAQKYGVTGAGVGVAVIDSGVRPSDDISGREPVETSMIPGNYNPDDLCGHGTHVAGIIAGNGADSTGSQYTKTFYGVARSANIISLRVLDNQGQGDASTVIAAIQYAVTNKTKYNIRVINLSLGHPVGESYTTDPLCQAAETAWKAGIVVVCAAGNEGRLFTTQTAGQANEGWGHAYGMIQSPGNDPYVITVGATKSMDGNRADDRIATYSSRGPSRLDLILKPDIIAPGNQVVSLYSYGGYLYTWNTNTNSGLPAQFYINTTWTGYSAQYFRLSGTSMASPVVAGAAALMLQANPALTPDMVKARLMASADKWRIRRATPTPAPTARAI